MPMYSKTNCYFFCSYIESCIYLPFKKRYKLKILTKTHTSRNPHTQLCTPGLRLNNTCSRSSMFALTNLLSFASAKPIVCKAELCTSEVRGSVTQNLFSNELSPSFFRSLSPKGPSFATAKPKWFSNELRSSFFLSPKWFSLRKNRFSRRENQLSFACTNSLSFASAKPIVAKRKKNRQVFSTHTNRRFVSAAKSCKAPLCNLFAKGGSKEIGYKATLGKRKELEASLFSKRIRMQSTCSEDPFVNFFAIGLTKPSFVRPIAVLRSCASNFCFASITSGSPSANERDFAYKSSKFCFCKTNCKQSVEKTSNKKIKNCSTTRYRLRVGERTKAALSGEVFKESFIDIFHTNFEQVAFSLVCLPSKARHANKSPLAHSDLIKNPDTKEVQANSNVNKIHFSTLKRKELCFARTNLFTDRKFVIDAKPRSEAFNFFKSTASSLKTSKESFLKAERVCNHNFCSTQNKAFVKSYKRKRTPILLNRKIGDYLSSGDKIGHLLSDKELMPFSYLASITFGYKSKICMPSANELQNRALHNFAYKYKAPHTNRRFVRMRSFAYNWFCRSKTKKICKRSKVVQSSALQFVRRRHTNLRFVTEGDQSEVRRYAKPVHFSLFCYSYKKKSRGLSFKGFKSKASNFIFANTKQRKVRNFARAFSFFAEQKSSLANPFTCFLRSEASKFFYKKPYDKIVRKFAQSAKPYNWTSYKSLKLRFVRLPYKARRTPVILGSSGRVVTISKTQLILQKTQPVLFYNSANLHVKKGEWVKEGSPILTLTHQTLITGDIVQGIPRIEQLFEAFTSPPPTFKDRERVVTKFKDVHDTLHSQVRDIFRKHWLKSVLPIAVRKSLEEIQYILVENIQKVYLSQGVLIADKHIEIIIRQIACKGQILDSGSTGLFLEEILPIRHIENANLATPGKKCLYVPAVLGLTAAALSCDSFISAASFQETTRVLSRDAVVGKSDFLRGLKEKVVIGDLISAGTGLEIYFIYTTMISISKK